MLDLEDEKKIINLHKRGEKPSINDYIEKDEEEQNMMNVDEVDQKLIDLNPRRKKKIRKENRKSAGRKRYSGLE